METSQKNTATSSRVSKLAKLTKLRKTIPQTFKSSLEAILQSIKDEGLPEPLLQRIWGTHLWTWWDWCVWVQQAEFLEINQKAHAQAMQPRHCLAQSCSHLWEFLKADLKKAEMQSLLLKAYKDHVQAVHNNLVFAQMPAPALFCNVKMKRGGLTSFPAGTIESLKGKGLKKVKGVWWNIRSEWTLLGAALKGIQRLRWWFSRWSAHSLQLCCKDFWGGGCDHGGERDQLWWVENSCPHEWEGFGSRFPTAPSRAWG